LQAVFKVFGIRKLLEIFPALAGFGTSHPADVSLEEEAGEQGQESFQASTKSGSNGFESLGSIIKN